MNTVVSISSFRGKYSFLSNFHLCPIDLDGVVYPSVEHAFQSSKTVIAAERFRINVYVSVMANATTVQRVSTPGEAKKAAGPKAAIPITLRPDWEDIKYAVMDRLLHIKFAHPELRNQLLSTHDAELIEGNYWHDNTWGVCGCVQCGGMGQNILGNLLMALRTELSAVHTT